MSFEVLSIVFEIDRCWKVYTTGASRVEVTIEEAE